MTAVEHASEYDEIRRHVLGEVARNNLQDNQIGGKTDGWDKRVATQTGYTPPEEVDEVIAKAAEVAGLLVAPPTQLADETAIKLRSDNGRSFAKPGRYRQHIQATRRSIQEGGKRFEEKFPGAKDLQL